MGQENHFERFCRVLLDINASLHLYSEVEDVLATVVRKSAEAFKAKGAIVRIFNLETHQQELSAAYGLSDQFLSKGPASSEGIITNLHQQDKIIIIRDILNDPHVKYPQEAWAEGIRMIIDAPLTLRKDVLGILRIYFGEPREFSEDELNFITLVTGIGATLIEKDRLIEMQKSRFDQLVLQTERLSSLGRMAAGIAHEINNPLGGILLFSSNMLKKVPTEGPMREGLEIIVQEALRCKTIIQELLEFSRESEPKMVLANVNKVMEKALSILGNEFRLTHIRLEKHLSTQVPDILIDVNQIEQIFVNLLLNAIQAIEDEGSVTLRTDVTPNRKNVTIEISDTGCGILPEHMDKIFDPFFSTKTKGTGLGLAVVYGIVQKHKGRIYVSSQPKQGARFVVELPTPSKFLPNQSEGGNETR
jgi:two-component system, NtrC family, sensor kinase